MNYFTNGSVSRWSGKKWAVIGDSITNEPNRATKNYHTYIAAKIGCTVINYGVAGTGWRTPNSSGVLLPFYQRISAMDTSADLITVFGGTNDWDEVGISMALGTFGDTTTATFYGSVDNVLTQLITKYPTKTVAVFTPAPRNNNWSDKGGNGVTLENVADAIIKVCRKYSIPVLDLYRGSNMSAWDANFRSYAMPDGLHPNNTGQELLANKILSFINSL